MIGRQPSFHGTVIPTKSQKSVQMADLTLRNQLIIGIFTFFEIHLTKSPR
jgi:hypothetical protein